MWRVLVLWKPTLPIRLSRWVGSQVRMFSIVRLDCIGFCVVGSRGGLGISSVCRRCIAAAVTVSFVCEESISAVRV